MNLDLSAAEEIIQLVLISKYIFINIYSVGSKLKYDIIKVFQIVKSKTNK